jgi:hypothetical protein
MATTQFADVFIPAVWAGYETLNSPELTNIFQSGVVVRTAELDAILAKSGTFITVPFFGDLDATIEPNYSTDNPADIAVPNKVGTGEWFARKMYINQSWACADIIPTVIGADPMQRIKDRTGTYWTRRWQRYVIAVFNGMLGANKLNNASDMVIDISAASGVAGNANMFNLNSFLAAVYTSGDQHDLYRTLLVHSNVMLRMRQNNQIVYEHPADGSPDIATFQGMRVIADDSMPVSGPDGSGNFKYTSVLSGDGTIGYGSELGGPPAAELYHLPQQGNGAGVDTWFERYNWLIHPFGHSWNMGATLHGGANNPGSPNVADLAAAANWTRTVARKQMPIVFLVTNG